MTTRGLKLGNSFFIIIFFLGKRRNSNNNNEDAKKSVVAIFKIHVVIDVDFVSFVVVPGGIIDLLVGYEAGYMDRHYHALMVKFFSRKSYPILNKV